MSDSWLALSLLPVLALLLWSLIDKRADQRTKLAAALLAVVAGGFVAFVALT